MTPACWTKPKIFKAITGRTHGIKLRINPPRNAPPRMTNSAGCPGAGFVEAATAGGGALRGAAAIAGEAGHDCAANGFKGQLGTHGEARAIKRVPQRFGFLARIDFEHGFALGIAENRIDQRADSAGLLGRRVEPVGGGQPETIAMGIKS